MSVSFRCPLSVCFYGLILLSTLHGEPSVNPHLPQRADVQQVVDRQTWVRPAGIVERGLDRAHWVLEAGTGNDPLEIPVSADSVLQRSVIKLQAKEEGFAPLLSWESVGIAAEYAEGYWTLFYRSAGTAEWQASEFSVYGAESPVWLNLDIVRTSRDFVSGYLIFINGAQIAHIETDDKSAERTPASPAKFSQLSFADVKLTDVAHLKDYPAYVMRALQKPQFRAGHLTEQVEAEPGHDVKEKPAQTAERFSRQDAQRKQSLNYSKIRVDVQPGDLSFSEQAEFLTQTVNRAYYYFSEDFRLERAPRDVARLELWGGDYLPTLESRSWVAPVRYADWADDYIEKIYGYIVPEISGFYRFWIGGDEAGALFLSSSSDAADLSKVASFDRPTGQYQWNAQPAQRSEPVELEAGVAYYFEAWHVERNGADHLAVAWSLPGETDAFPGELIPARVLSSFGSGEPGTWPRSLHYTDASLLPDPAEFGSPGGVRASQMTVINDDGTLRLYGNQYISIDNYTTVYFDPDGGWLYHAYQDNWNGIGWTFSDLGSFPSIYSNALDWIWYKGSTANPQVFFQYQTGVYLEYSHSNKLTYFVTESMPSHAGFQSDLLPWKNTSSGDSDDWVWKSGYTGSSGTGPSSGNGGTGYYVFFETSSPYAFYNGDSADLIISGFETPPSGATVSFFYHMYGQDIGSLDLEAVIDGSWTLIWSKTGQQHSSHTAAWTRAEVTIPSTVGDVFTLRFRAVAAGGYRGDIAIDDILVYETGADSDGDGLSDAFEAFYGLDPFTPDNYSSDPNGDLFSIYVASLSGLDGLNGFGNPTYWSANSTLNTAVQSEGHGLVLVIPDEGVFGVNTQSLEISPVAH